MEQAILECIHQQAREVGIKSRRTRLLSNGSAAGGQGPGQTTAESPDLTQLISQCGEVQKKQVSKCSLAARKGCAGDRGGSRESCLASHSAAEALEKGLLSGHLKEVVWSEKKSKEAGVAEQNAEREGRGDKELGTAQGQPCTSERNSGLTLKGTRRHS